MQIVINIDKDGMPGVAAMPEASGPVSVASADGTFDGGAAPVGIGEDTPAEATAGIGSTAADTAFDGGESRYSTGR